MKSSTKVIIGAAAGAGLLYFMGKRAVKDMCIAQSTPASLPANIQQIIQAALPGGATPDQMCQIASDAIPLVTAIKVGAIQFWRPITAEDLV